MFDISRVSAASDVTWADRALRDALGAGDRARIEAATSELLRVAQASERRR